MATSTVVGRFRPFKAVPALVKSGASSGGDSDEEHPVTFTLGAAAPDGLANSDSSPTSPNHHETAAERSLPWKREAQVHVNPVAETEAERVLPWNRPTVMEQPVRSFASLTMQEEDSPLMSEAPSWASNPAYHHLKESGSPYTSPQTSVVVPESQARRPVFDLFPPPTAAAATTTTSSSAPSAEKAQVQSLPEVPPPPWSAAGEDDEPLPSPSITVSSADKLTHAHSTHNLIPPTHRVFVSPEEEHHPPGGPMHRLSVADSLAIASTPDSPKHFPLLERDACRQAETETEIMAECAGYQEQVQSRVTEWLKLAHQGSGGEEADIDEEKSPDDAHFHYDYDPDTEESDIETSHL